MIDRRLYSLTPSIRRLWIWLALISAVLTSLIVAQMYFLSRIIHGAFMDQQTLGTMLAPIGFLLLTIALRGGLIAAQHQVSQRAAVRIKSDCRNHAVAHLFTQGPVALTQERTGAITATLTDGLEKIDAYFARYIPRAIHVMITPLTIALFVVVIDPISGLLLLFTGPLIPLFMWLIGTSAQKRTEKQWTALSRMSAHFLDVLQGLTTLKLFGRDASQTVEIRRISNRYRLTTMGVLKVAFLSGMVLELAASFSTAIVAVQIGVRLIEGHLLFQPGLFVLLLAPEFYLPFRQLGTEHHAAMEGKAAANDLFALMDKPVQPPPATPRPLPDTIESITFSGVGYCYPERTAPALDNISARLVPGEIIALVGSSGAGKSTIFHLLARHLIPDRGVIELNGINLQDIDPAEWRQRLAVVPQRPTLFHGTVADNLRLARPDATDEAVIEAARLAEADIFIRQLPDGYETPLGEQAWCLSGGERQRLALARAFLKDAPILLLDEPSSNLDPESEEAIAAACERLTRGRLTLIIAHRLRTVFRANRILVLDHGKLVEEGTHADLSKRAGIYARLVGGMA